MREALASDAILPLSKTPQSGRKGGDLAGGTQIYSVQFQPAAEDSFCRAGGSITVTEIPTIALQQ